MTKRVLVTNDDGIDADGLRVLVAALVEHGYEPVVVAPDRDYSGAGTSIITAAGANDAVTDRRISYVERTLPEAPDAQAVAIGAPPAMCVLLAMRGAFGDPPGLIASGINYGLNVGGAVRHSGTVSAAVTGAAFGVPAVAISAEFDFTKPDESPRYDTAAAVAIPLLELLSASPHSVLNINVPRCSIAELAGVAPATLSRVSRYRSFVESRDHEFLQMGFMMTDDVVEPGSDTALVMAGYAAVSSLVGTSSVDCADLIERLAEAAA